MIKPFFEILPNKYPTVAFIGVDIDRSQDFYDGLYFLKFSLY
jgi:hypothetical protein